MTRQAPGRACQGCSGCVAYGRRGYSGYGRGAYGEQLAHWRRGATLDGALQAAAAWRSPADRYR